MTVPQWPVGRGAAAIGLDFDAVCLVFSRKETEALRIGRSVDDLMLLTDDHRRRRQPVHGLFFSFEGWGNDPREVMFIPECRRYLRALYAQWPYWLHFLKPWPDVWAVLLLCLADPMPLASEVPGLSKMSVNATEVRDLVEGMLLPLNLLHQDMGLGELERREIFELSLRAIQAGLA